MYGGGMRMFNISVLTFLRWSTWERLKEALHWQYPCCCFLCHLYCIQFLFPILLPQQSRIFHYCHSLQLTIAIAFGSNPQNAWKFIPFVHHIVLFSSFQKFSLVYKWRKGHLGKNVPLPNDLELRIMVKMWGAFFLVSFAFFFSFFFSCRGGEKTVKDTQIFLILIIIVYVWWKPF